MKPQHAARGYDMKLSTRSRYGTRMMLDMAQHYDEGPVQIGDIARRVDVSVKYLEQLVIPLKKTGYVKSLRGAKGGQKKTSTDIAVIGGVNVPMLVSYQIHFNQLGWNDLLKKIVDDASKGIILR